MVHGAAEPALPDTLADSGAEVLLFPRRSVRMTSVPAAALPYTGTRGADGVIYTRAAAAWRGERQEAVDPWRAGTT